MCAVRHAEREVHVESRRGGALDAGRLGGVVEVGELHQLVQSVVGRQGRVEQHVGHIGGGQHVEASAHAEGLQRAVHAGIEVDIGLTEGDGLGLLPGVDEQQVAGSHAHVHLNLVEVREVDVALHVQRLFVIGIESEVLEQQVGAHDAHGVIVEAHAHAVGHADQVGRVEVDFAVDVGRVGGALDGQLAFAVALQTYQLVGNEAVGYRQREACHREGGIDSARVLTVGVGGERTLQQSELLIVEQETGLDGVATVLTLHVDELAADIADGSSLVGHLLDGHIRHDGDMLLAVHHDVVVAVELTAQVWQVGQH